MTEPRIVESGPINIKLDLGTAIQALLSDPEFAEKVRALIKEMMLKKLQEQVKEMNDG